MTKLIKPFFTDRRTEVPINVRLWTRIAWIAGVFSFLVCTLLIANYIQFKKADPVNMTVINTLVDRLSQDPSDTKLREEIRTLDLLSRKAYFTNQWQIKMGGYFLLAGILLLIISLQVISLSRKKNPVIGETIDGSEIVTRYNARKWITVSGALFIVIALLLAWISQKNMEPNITPVKENIKEAGSDSTNSVENLAEEPVATPSTSDTGSLGEKNTISKENISATTITATIAEVSSNDNYPSFRGPGGLGIAGKKNPPTDWDIKSGKNVLWKMEIPLPGNNSPVIWGNKLFITGADASKRAVFCFDINSGKILWTTAVSNIPGSPSAAPKVSPETGFSAPTAATNGKVVCAVFSNGDLIALDMEGKKQWAQSLGMPQNHYGHSSSLLIVNDLLIVQYDQRTAPKLIAFSLENGKQVWTAPRQVKISWSSPILINSGGLTEIIAAAEPYVAGYDPKDGKELWKMECVSGEVGPSPAYANGIVYSVNDYSKLTAIKLGDQPQQLWESDEFLSDIPSPVATDKYLFVATSYGVAVCYDAVNGTKYWEKEFNNTIHASPIVDDGKVYLIDRTGLMHIFKADKEFAGIAEIPLGEKVSATPAFTNGRIYIRGEKNLYCLGK